MNYQNKKRILCSVLAALMIAASGTMVFAKDFSDVDKTHTGSTEIDILSDIGVIKGTSDKEFSPDDPVTREQMAALLFRLMLNKEDAGRVNTTGFTDLYEPFYNGAISWANAAGYIIGTSKVTFDPTGGISLQDAMTMLVRALGQETGKMNENYPWSYINAAIKLGLDRGLEDVAYEKTLTRAETAVILYNALTSEYLIGKTAPNGNVYYESTSIIEEVFGYSMAEATLVSTNQYTTIEDTVVKNDYVTLSCVGSDGKSFYMTVPFADMHLSGSANDQLGASFRVIYQTKNGKHNVLSAVATSQSKSFDEAKISADGKTVEIGGVKYTLVDEYSDSLATNNNELILHAYDDNGKLTKIDSIDALKPLLGFYRITLWFDGGSETATRGVLRSFSMGKLNVDKNGKINLADNLTEKELTGGFRNADDAVSGDYVLYYFNKNTKELEIAETLEIVSGTVRKITTGTAKIGDLNYTLGNETAGIPTASIRDALTLGATVHAVVYNNTIVALHEGAVNVRGSEYLVALSDSYRVYENGAFRYVATVSVNGETKNVYVNDSSVREGEIYRYTVSADTYTLTAPKIENGLIVSGTNAFIQSGKTLDEIAFRIESAKNTTITLNSRNYYTLHAGDAEAVSSVAGMQDAQFITDENTLILVNDNGKLMTRRGAYNSTITVNDGATVTAVMNNEVGTVETLRVLYISDGSLGNYDVNGAAVRILAINGMVLEDGRAFVEYTVYNFDTNTVEVKLSTATLEVGADYRIGSDGNITTEKTEQVSTGFVTGYTGSTITVDGTTLSVAKDAHVIRLTKDNKAEEVKLSDTYLHHVEFVVDRGEVKLIMLGATPQFTMTAKDNVLTVTPDFDLTNIDTASVKLGSVQIDGKNVTGVLEVKDGALVVTFAETLTDGKYTVSFTIAGATYVTEASVEVKRPATDVIPENPETPETPENPGTPEQTENL